GSSAAWVEMVVIVRVEVAPLVFGNVTEVGDRLQVGAGAGPCTVHVNAIGLVNEGPSGKMFAVSVSVLPRCTAMLEKLSQKAKFGSVSNSAVTVWSEVIAGASHTKASPPMPLHAPPQPPKPMLASGVAEKLAENPVGSF